MLRLSPVQLPAGICPQFVVTAIERVIELEESLSSPLLHLHNLPLHQVSVMVPQLGVEHAADLRGPVRVRLSRICREPDGVPQEIARVVHVHEHLLLRDPLAEEAEAVDQWQKTRRVFRHWLGVCCGMAQHQETDTDYRATPQHKKWIMHPHLLRKLEW
ncbi:MAG: hypothetical protein IJV20_10260 [Prevotella sp.]|nr:hypothetical protein [Prevotella sp.]